MMKNKKKRKNDYRHIKSYKDLCHEKMHLAYRTRYTEKQLQIKFLELGYSLHPARLIPNLLVEWARPMLWDFLSRVKSYLFGTKRKSHQKQTSKDKDE
ncbi:hypothetical protein [Thermophagus xiamenensis]|nr:hypothetical protein [Thermophagus xiamenensis]